MANFFESLTQTNEGTGADFEVITETARILQERSVVRMDKSAMRKKLLTQATLLAAKDAGDPLYKKYVKATKIRKQCRHAIQQKYASKGKAKMREYLVAQQGR